MIKGHDIICLSGYYYGHLKQRYEHLMLRLSAENRILFIEYPGSVFERISSGSLLKSLNGLQKVNENFFVLTPVPTVPLKHILPISNKLSQSYNGLFYRKVLKKLSFKNPILWLTLPNQHELIGKMNEKLSIYDCVDNHSSMLNVVNKTIASIQAHTIAGMENKMLKKAGLVFVSANGLVNGRNLINPNVHLVQNACDIDHFKKSMDKGTHVLEMMKGIRKPVIGFYGQIIHSKIDFELINRVASKFSQCSVVLIGPRNVPLNIFRKNRNIHVFDEVPYEDLPGYLKCFDVAIIPFLDNEVIECTDPIKLYEYIASGKKVVVTNFREAERFREVIDIAGTPEEFIGHIERALNTGQCPDYRKSLGLLKDNTWENRVEQISLHIDRSLGGILP